MRDPISMHISTHSACTLHALCVHSACIQVHALSMHSACTHRRGVKHAMMREAISMQSLETHRRGVKHAMHRQHALALRDAGDGDER